MSIVTFRISAHVAGNFSTTIQLHFLSAASDAASGVGGCSQTYPLKRAPQHGSALAVASVSGAVRDAMCAPTSAHGVAALPASASVGVATSAPPAEIAPSLPAIQRDLHGLIVGTVAPACHKAVAATLSRVAGRV